MNKGYNIPCEFVSITPNDEWTNKLGEKMRGKILLQFPFFYKKS